MSKGCLYLPPKIFDDDAVKWKVRDIVCREFEALWPDECEGGDPTWIIRRGDGLHLAGDFVFWGGPEHPRDAYMTGYLRAVCKLFPRLVA